MEDEKISVPYIVYEGAQARQERLTKKLMILIIVLICMLFASNAIWLYAWTSYDYVEEGEEIAVDVNADDGGNANFIGRDLSGVLVNGENYDPSESQDTQEN